MRSVFISLATLLMSLSLNAAEFHPEVFQYINLDYAGLEKVKACVDKADYRKAAEELLIYYRARPEIKMPDIDIKEFTVDPVSRKLADAGLRHYFVCGKDGGDPWFYGKDINWQYWPKKDIERRVGVHRLRWWLSMGQVYALTKDEKYAKEWVYQFSDWIKKNPYIPFVIDQGGTFSSGTIAVDSPNECFVWRPLDCSVRLLQFCHALACFVPSRHFTPVFLTEFLFTYYLNAAVMIQTLSPGGNHLLFEASRLIYAGLYFPEFKDAPKWLDLGFEILNRESLAQIMPDGCQYELDPAYQYDVLHIYGGAYELAEMHNLGGRFSAECRDRYRKAIRYGLEYLYPDGSGPCFSDCRADNFPYKGLASMAEMYDDDMLRWFISDGKKGAAPDHNTKGFPESGFYTFRSGWDSTSVIMPFKATERGMWHAQPDFGTFELYAYGKRLMPDAGCYTYSGDAEIERWRAYFKATARHNAVTLDDRNYDNPSPKVLEWRPEGDVQSVCVEHEAYEGLSRRRGIAFVDEKFFVILDEVKGAATGNLALRFGFGSGKAGIDGKSVVYTDGDRGLVMALNCPETSSVTIEKDWYSLYYLKKSERSMAVVRVPRTSNDGVQRFVSVICPFRDGQVPSVAITCAPRPVGGRTVVTLTLDGKPFEVSFPGYSDKQ